MAFGVSLRMAIVSDHAYITTLVVIPNINYEKRFSLIFVFPKTQSILLCIWNQLKRIFLIWDQMALTLESKSLKEGMKMHSCPHCHNRKIWKTCRLVLYMSRTNFSYFSFTRIILNFIFLNVIHCKIILAYKYILVILAVIFQ